MKRGLLVVLLLAMASFMWAQDKSEKKSKEMKHEHAAVKQEQQMAAHPAPEITKLIKMFSGSWTTAEKIEPGPRAPKGATGNGRATFKAGPGGNSVIEDYKGNAMGPFQGMGVIWWDAKAGTYKGTWCDSMAPDCMVGGMKAEGNDLVGVPQEMDMGGQKMVMTSKYTNIMPNSFTYTMGMGPTAEQAKTTMTLVYTRSGKATAAPAGKKDAEATKK